MLKNTKTFSYCNLVVIHWSESELQEQEKEDRGSSHTSLSFKHCMTSRDQIKHSSCLSFQLSMHITAKKSKTVRKHQPHRKYISYSSRALIQSKLSTVNLAKIIGYQTTCKYTSKGTEERSACYIYHLNLTLASQFYIL